MNFTAIINGRPHTTAYFSAVTAPAPDARESDNTPDSDISVTIIVTRTTVILIIMTPTYMYITIYNTIQYDNNKT